MEFYIILLVTLTAVATHFVLHRNSYCVVTIGGKYAARRGYILYEYKDFHATYWWGQDSQFFPSCLTDDLDKAKTVLAMVSDRGTKI